MKKKRVFLKVLIVLVCLGALGIGALFGINGIVKGTTRDHILSPEDAAKLQDVDCILVLGCGVWDNGQPSHMLEDRLKRSLELYQSGTSEKILMSGDHGQTDYDEVNVMKSFVVDAGVPAENVFMDHAGFSTYESMYRAKEIFKVEKMIIISQEYHLYRAIYIARRLGIEAYGVSSNYRNYVGQSAMDTREVLARVKDFAVCIFKPEPTYLGEAIPIWGDGNLTNDENSDIS